MSSRTHWDAVYRTKAAEQVSWYRAHLERSLAFVEAIAPDRAAAIIDVGGGESTLVDDLLARGYQSHRARRGAVRDRRSEGATRSSRGERALAGRRHHDGRTAGAALRSLARPRGVSFPHLAKDRTAYVRQVLHAVRPRGYVVVATFGPEGPEKCSGLPVVRYDANRLHDEFGAAFRLIDSAAELHRTPAGAVQQFTYCFCRVAAADG